MVWVYNYSKLLPMYGIYLEVCFANLLLVFVTFGELSVVIYHGIILNTTHLFLVLLWNRGTKIKFCLNLLQGILWVDVG